MTFCQPLAILKLVEEWDVAISINWSDQPVSPARSYTKVIIKLEVLDTHELERAMHDCTANWGLGKWSYTSMLCNSQSKVWEEILSQHAMQ